MGEKIPEITKSVLNQTYSSAKVSKHRLLVHNEFVKRLNSKTLELPKSDEILGIFYEASSLEYWIKLMLIPIFSSIIFSATLLILSTILNKWDNYKVYYLIDIPIYVILPIIFYKFSLKFYSFNTLIFTKDAIFGLQMNRRKKAYSKTFQVNMNEIATIRFKKSLFGTETDKGKLEICETNGGTSVFKISLGFKSCCLLFLSILKNKGMLHRVMQVNDLSDPSQMNEDNNKINRNEFKTESTLSKSTLREVLLHFVIGIPCYFCIALLHVYFYNRASSEHMIIFWLVGSYFLIGTIIIMGIQAKNIADLTRHTNKKETNVIVSTDSIKIVSDREDQNIIIPYQKDMIIRFVKVSYENLIQDKNSNMISIKYLNSKKKFTIGRIEDLVSFYNELISKFLSWVENTDLLMSSEEMQENFKNASYYPIILKNNDRYELVRSEFIDFVFLIKQKMLVGEMEGALKLVEKKYEESMIKGYHKIKLICLALLKLKTNLDTIIKLYDFPERTTIEIASAHLGMTKGELVTNVIENQIFGDFQIEGNFIVKKAELTSNASKDISNVNTPREMQISKIFDRIISSYQESH